MATIPFPNVPNSPGVPALPRSPLFPPTVQAALGAFQAALWRVTQVQAQWGIFDSKGKALGDPAQLTGRYGGIFELIGMGPTLSTGSLNYAKETKVSDFPVEGGGFASYNKVETPASPLVTLHLAGSEADRRSFLNAIDAASKATELYSVVTPEITYINHTIERYSYQRTASKGATLLSVEISLKEVREVSAAYDTSNSGGVDTPKDAGATPKADNGKVQAQTPKTSTAKSVIDKLPALGEYLTGLFK